MKIPVAILMWCCTISLTAQAQPRTGTSHDVSAAPAATEFRRADRSHGFKLGFSTTDSRSPMGVQADVILFNRMGLEVATALTAHSARARYYILDGAVSPYVGIGTGMLFENEGLWSGSWKEAHIGFESAFNSGIVLQMQFLKFFDQRGDATHSYTFAPGIGYRL